MIVHLEMKGGLPKRLWWEKYDSPNATWKSGRMQLKAMTQLRKGIMTKGLLLSVVFLKFQSTTVSAFIFIERYGFGWLPFSFHDGDRIPF